MPNASQFNLPLLRALSIVTACEEYEVVTNSLLKHKLRFTCVCMCTRVHAHTRVCECRGWQRPEEGIKPFGDGSQAVVSHLTPVLGIILGSSARASVFSQLLSHFPRPLLTLLTSKSSSPVSLLWPGVHYSSRPHSMEFWCPFLYAPGFLNGLKNFCGEIKGQPPAHSQL